jgi:beta-phosphoglucomutase-like phosphatase (HAD superfamily)
MGSRSPGARHRPHEVGWWTAGAAHLLDVEPARAAVFEDALAGVASGRAGHFGYVVGVDRVGQAEALAAHGADRVVPDLAELLEPS